MINMQVSAQARGRLEDTFENLDIYISREKDGIVSIEVSSFNHTFIKARCYVNAEVLKEMVESIVESRKTGGTS